MKPSTLSTLGAAGAALAPIACSIEAWERRASMPSPRIRPWTISSKAGTRPGQSIP